MKFLSKFKKSKILFILVFTIFLSGGAKNRESSESVEAPLSLTASDGAGLVLKSYESNTVLDGFFAFTEIKLSFYNPEDRQREGRFRIALPDNAHLARFAMKIGNDWQEGEVVEKEKAVRVYEDFLHRRQDPALLESDAGNEFSARVFPITAKSEKNIIISYSTTLSSFPPVYTLPIKGLPKIEDFKTRVIFDEQEFGSKNDFFTETPEGKVSSKKIISLQKKNFKPSDDIRFEHKIKGNLISQKENLFAAEFVPIQEDQGQKTAIDNLVVLVDTSASAALQFPQTLDKLEKLLSGLNPKEFHVFGFDTSLGFYGTGKKGILKLGEVKPLGSSNLSLAVSGISKEIGTKDARLLVVSDGVATAGEIQRPEIAKILKKEKWISRLDFVVPGSYKDTSMIQTLLSLGKETGVMASFTDDISIIIKKLTQKVFLNPTVTIADTKWFSTGNIASLQPGDSITLYGEFKSNESKLENSILFNGKKITGFHPITTESVLFEREVVAARINRLLELSDKEENEDSAKGLKLQARELSITHRIQCPLTSFLVLETQEDYDRFQITRNSLTDILTVGIGGLEVLNRKESVQYGFLDPQNIEKRKLENRKKSENPSRPNQNRMEKEDDAKVVSGAPKDESEESAPTSVVNDPITSGDSNIPTNSPPVRNADRLPDRNHFQVESTTIAPRPPPAETSEKQKYIEPHTGNLKKFYALLKEGNHKKALEFAWEWRKENPEDILALLALGDAYYALNDPGNATRAYASFVDYFPVRADIRRWAGEKLLAIGDYETAIDTLKISLAQRPDHPSTYHLLSIAYLKLNLWKDANSVLVKGLNTQFSDRFQNVHDIFYDDLDLVYTLAKNSGVAWTEPVNEGKTIIKPKSLKKEIRFILAWETDANDVDFHIYDKSGNHAFYSKKELESGGALYADLTGGYGPECFRITNPKAFPYRLEAHYYSRGPMGYGMGALQIIRFDGEKKLDLETRNFVIMNDGAYIDLGVVK
ncbi:VIT domain-containing protein [Leptospira sp. 'Mane']|uniref:VIT domain-containing protein n=1 Tax=Leptospira sp. 'Mane' TaxID=3387407 RepID=UPI00398B8E80